MVYNHYSKRVTCRGIFSQNFHWCFRILPWWNAKVPFLHKTKPYLPYYRIRFTFTYISISAIFPLDVKQRNNILLEWLLVSFWHAARKKRLPVWTVGAKRKVPSILWLHSTLHGKSLMLVYCRENIWILSPIMSANSEQWNCRRLKGGPLQELLPWSCTFLLDSCHYLCLKVTAKLNKKKAVCSCRCTKAVLTFLIQFAEGWEN